MGPDLDLDLDQDLDPDLDSDQDLGQCPDLVPDLDLVPNLDPELDPELDPYLDPDQELDQELDRRATRSRAIRIVAALILRLLSNRAATQQHQPLHYKIIPPWLHPDTAHVLPGSPTRPSWPC